MIWDVLILGHVVVNAIIIATTVIIAAIITAAINATPILVRRQKERHIVLASKMDATILAAGLTNDKRG